MIIELNEFETELVLNALTALYAEIDSVDIDALHHKIYELKGAEHGSD